MSTRPCCSSTRSTSACTSASTLTSAMTAVAPISAATTSAAAASTSAITTAAAPSAANRRASAAPIPLAPPVTMATRPATSTTLEIVATDWVAWHDQYEADGALVRRLEVVRRLIRTALDSAPAGEIHVVSMCAGDGRDLLGVLADHPRLRDVRPRLVQLEPTLVERARAEAGGLELDGVEVVCGDAARTNAYEHAVPAEVVLVCGVFG